MTLANPSALIALILIPFMMGLFAWQDWSRRRTLGRLGESHLIAQLTPDGIILRQRWKQALRLIALFCVILALARPAWGIDEEFIDVEGISIMVVMDVSASMNAQDILPSRLQRAKLAARNLFSEAQGNQLGLILFAGDAFVQFPLTTDAQTALTFLEAASSRSVTRQGTALEEALLLAVNSFDARIASHSVIVVLTDGENHQGDPVAAAEEAANKDIVIHTIGYGNPEGAPVPEINLENQVTGYKTDAAGNVVVSQLDETILQEIAEISGGTYHLASPNGVEITDVLNTVSEIEAGFLERRSETHRVERFELFVLLAVIALGLEMAIGDHRINESDCQMKLRIFMLLATLAVTGCASTASRNQAGNSDYNRGKYDNALLDYERAQVNAPDEAIPYYNAAASYRELDELETAKQALEQAIENADETVILDAYYNLGNVLFDMRQYSEAVVAYQEVLLRDPEHEAARYNLEIALLRDVRPTVTAQEQQTEPQQDNTDPETTPTNQPGGFDGPTPTPPPQDFDLTATPDSGEGADGDQDSSTPIPQSQGQMTVEQAEQLLEQIQQDQDALREYLDDPASEGDVIEKDW